MQILGTFFQICSPLGSSPSFGEEVKSKSEIAVVRTPLLGRSRRPSLCNVLLTHRGNRFVLLLHGFCILKVGYSSICPAYFSLPHGKWMLGSFPQFVLRGRAEPRRRSSAGGGGGTGGLEARQLSSALQRDFHPCSLPQNQPKNLERLL